MSGDGDSDGTLFRKATGQLGEDRQVGMEPDPIEPSDAELGERPFVLEPSELALDRTTPAVQVARPLRVARNQGVQPVSLDPT